jgi:hypothetical protein
MIRGNGYLMKGELSPDQVKPTSNSPTSQRSGYLGAPGYVGATQDVSYFSNVITKMLCLFRESKTVSGET